MPLVPRHIQELESYKPGRRIIDVKNRVGFERIVKLASNENPMGCSPKAINAVAKNLNENYRYPDASAIDLRKKLAKKFNIKIENVTVGAGSEGVMSTIMRTFLKIGDEIISGKNKEIQIGNCMPLSNIPVGTDIHNIELMPNGGGKLVRSAGSSAQISGSDENYSIVKLNSGEIRKIISSARATIGSVSNTDHQNIKIGKAGRNRWKGKRPSVRGVAMNPVDHPHGGGEGKTSGGRSPVSPWGQSAKGLKTRKNKVTNKFIILRRKKKN